MKQCSKCGAEYPATTEYFYKNRNTLGSYCKPCEKIRGREKARKKAATPAGRAHTNELNRKRNSQLVMDPNTGELITFGALTQRRLVTDPETGDVISAGNLMRRKRTRNGKRAKYYQTYMQVRLAVDSTFKLRTNLSTLVRQHLNRRGYLKTSKTAQMVGLSGQELGQYFDAKYPGWRSIENLALDHILPCACASTEEELIALQHYSNLRPITQAENCSKSDTRPDGWALELRLLVYQYRLRNKL